VRARSLLNRTFPCIKPQSWRWGYGQFHALLPSSFLDFYWFLVDELVFIVDATQVLPWLSNSVAESCSSLFVSDMPAVLKIKEWTSLVFVWKLHLQWPRDVFCVTMVILGLTRHNRQWTIDWWCMLAQECTPWCSGISLSCPCWQRASWSFWRWWKQAYSI